MDVKKLPFSYAFLLLIIVVVPLFSLGISNHGLWTPDEPRVAEIGREMAETGNWAVPTLNKRPFLESPPLYYGVLAMFYRIFGVSDTVARIPSALFCFGSVILLFFITNRLFNTNTALFSGIILATTGEFFRVAHWSIVDSALAFFVLAAMSFFILGYQSERSRDKLLHYVLFYIACTLGFYTKGFIGIVIPGIGVLVFIAFRRNFRELVRMKLWLGILIYLVLTAPWLITLWQQAGWEYLRIFFVHNHLQRFLPGSLAGSISGVASGHHNPFYYYITGFPAGFLPWSILLVPVLISMFSKRHIVFAKNSVSHTGLLFLKCWFFAGIAFLSIASTKRTLYLMPVFAPVAVMTAVYVNALLTANPLKRYEKVFLLSFGIVLMMAAFVPAPAHYYLSKQYSLPMQCGFSFLLWLGCILACLAAITGLFFLKRNETDKFFFSMVVSMFIIYLSVITYFFPLIDKEKSFVPFCSEVKRTVPADIPLYGYQPDETLRAVIPFYTGHYLIETETTSDILTQLRMGNPLHVVARDHKRKAENDLIDLHGLSLVAKYPMGTDKALILFSAGHSRVR